MTSLLFIRNSLMSDNIGLIETGAKLLVNTIDDEMYEFKRNYFLNSIFSIRKSFCFDHR
jgi:hypothetical protein